jgi:hypothetical protein
MSVQKAKQKAALVIAGSFVAVIAVPVLLVLFRDYIYITVIATTFTACLVATVWGIWEDIYNEIQAREKMIEDLYARCNSEKQRWFTKFYIEYFDL